MEKKIAPGRTIAGNISILVTRYLMNMFLLSPPNAVKKFLYGLVRRIMKARRRLEKARTSPTETKKFVLPYIMRKENIIIRTGRHF